MGKPRLSQEALGTVAELAVVCGVKIPWANQVTDQALDIFQPGSPQQMRAVVLALSLAGGKATDEVLRLKPGERAARVAFLLALHCAILEVE